MQQNSKTWLFFLTCSTGILLSACMNANSQPEHVQDSPCAVVDADSIPTIVGDFDGNGKKESLLLFAGTGHEEKETKYCSLVSFESELTEYHLSDCRSAHLEWEGDLNGDGGDEIGVLITGADQCRHHYNLLSYQQDGWQLVIQDLAVNCKVFDDPSDIIQPIPTKIGFVEVLGTVHHDEGYSVSPHYDERRLDFSKKKLF